MDNNIASRAIFVRLSEPFRATHLPEQPPHVLGRMDEFNDSDLVVAYTPVTNMTQRIMDKMALPCFMKGVLPNHQCCIIMQPAHVKLDVHLQIEFFCSAYVLVVPLFHRPWRGLVWGYR